MENKKQEGFTDRVTRLQLSKEQLMDAFRTMCTIRQFELMADRLYAAGKVHGTMHLSAGQEAVAVGLGMAIKQDDYFINHHRGHGHFIAKGADVNKMMAEFMGKDTGYCRGRGGSMHIADFTSHNLGANGIVGGGIPHSVGVGMALQMQKRKEIVVTVFGDGASNEGVFHEALNMASLWKLPNLYVCENNKYGMSMDIAKVAAKLPIAQRAEGYGIPWSYIDGNDVLTVYETMRDAVTFIHAGKGPVLVETQTYRYFGHSKSDRNLYRSKDEIEEWRSTKDPIMRFGRELTNIGLLNESTIADIDAEALKLIEAGVAFAEASPEPDPNSVMEYVYA